MSLSTKDSFRFKHFTVQQDKCTMKVGSDGVLLACWADIKSSTSILDIGTGTGLIALIAAQRNDLAQIDAVEIDQSAFEQAEENNNNSPWQNRIRIFHSPIQDFAKISPKQYEVIISNPPFFTGGVLSDNLDKNSVRHTIKLPHGELLSSIRKLLAPHGKFVVILPYLEGMRFVELAATYSLYCTKLTEVYAVPNKPISRLLLQFEKTTLPTEKSSLLLRNEQNEYTDIYKNLTQDFYLDF
ncbi:MAG: methyltransferase [Saprospiraceae bacterium]